MTPSRTGIQDSQRRLFLINPSNPLVTILNFNDSRWNRFRVWKPLGLMTIADLTPSDWEVTIIDENIERPDYEQMLAPDLVGITAFTSQANRAYEIATHFRSRGIPVVIGGIHATMCLEESQRYADTIVIGEAEKVWGHLLEDFCHNRLKSQYQGGFADMDRLPPAKHPLSNGKYAFGSIQTSRGCPLSCSFCSVTAFNGARFRQRPIDQVVDDFRGISEKLVLIVDDNLVGTSQKHILRAKNLFRAMVQADLKKEWVAQATINVAKDDELLALAAAAGCKGLFIGFESPRTDGLKELTKKNSLCRSDELAESVHRIQRHGILVAGSFIIGLDGDRPGIGRNIADTAEHYGVDFVNVLFLTPLPGTALWDKMEKQRRIVLNHFPEEWSYFTLTYPVARYQGLTLSEATHEMDICSRRFYSIPRILRRLWRNIYFRQSVRIGLAGGLSYRRNTRIDRQKLDYYQARYASESSSVDTNEEQQMIRSSPNVVIE